MRKEHTVSVTIVAFMCLALIATEASTQTKTSTTSPPTKKSPPIAAKTIPTIKCTDSESMVACKSFKQLVEAHDKRILNILMGTQSVSVKLSDYYRHIAYVCLAKNSDEFRTVDFQLPKGKSYKPYSFYLSEETEKRSNEQFAFLGSSTPNHPVDSKIQDQWFSEFVSQEVYDFDQVDVHEYIDGLHSDGEYDFGKWSRPSDTQNDPASDDAATFEGAYVWLARHTGVDKGAPDIGDDPEHSHISIVDGTVYVRYRFENNNGGTTDYRLHIQQSTGRFTETFTPLGKEAFENTGTCMIFKQ